jgi:prephenate dehydrogenase-like protein
VDVAVIGLGLIGGSLLQALAVRGHRVVGFDADPAIRATARTASARATAGTRWQVAGAIRDAIGSAELVVLAVPLTALPAVLPEMAGYSGLVTDVTSVKGPVRDLTPDFAFVGGHPMAGKETSGFRSADPGLFAGCAWVLCLEPDRTSLSTTGRLRRSATYLICWRRRSPPRWPTIRWPRRWLPARSGTAPGLPGAAPNWWPRCAAAMRQRSGRPSTTYSRQWTIYGRR